jgi:mono/diheme cytochrome c family protein
MKLKLIILVALFPSLAMAWPWSTDMMNQPSIKPQEGEMQIFPQRSIPVQGIPTKVANREEAKGLKNPIKLSKASLKKGKTLFKIYCSACHGLTGKADSPVSPKIGAISLVDSYVQENLTEGWIWGTMTFGSYVMPAYGVPTGKRGSNDLSVEERWHVVNYVRNELVNDSMKSTVAGM